MTASFQSASATSHVGRKHGVVVVGGGYAGLHAARAARRAGAAVTIVDRHGTHDFVTRLAAVAGGTAPADDAFVDLHAFDHDVEIGTVTGVGDGSVTLLDGITIEADAVVLTVGAGPAEPPLDGLEHALPLRTAEDARAIRTALDAAQQLVIIGGGPTGVQLAGAVAVQHPDVDVMIVDSSERLLANMSPESGRGAERILSDRDVEIRTRTEIAEITPEGALVGDDRVGGLVVWAGGFEPRTGELGLDVNESGRILVDDHLRVVGMRRTFAAGDIAAHLDDQGELLPMSAQVAVQAGRAAGANAAALVAGTELHVPSLTQRGWVLDLGGGRGVAEFGPLTLTGPLADRLPPLLHKAIDLKTRFGSGGIAALRF